MFPPKAQTLKLYFEIWLIIESIFPTLSKLCLDVMQDKGKIDRVFKKVSNVVDDNDSLKQFKKLLTLGFCTKDVLHLLYLDSACHKTETFFRELDRYKNAYFVVLSDNKDKYRKIFTKRKVWYYIAPFMHEKVKSTKDKLQRLLPTDVHISYNLKMNNEIIMNWVSVLLYFCCHEFSVKRDGNFFYGTCGRLTVHMLCNLENQTLEILYSHSVKENPCTCRRRIMVQGVHEFLTHHQILKEFISPIKSHQFLSNPIKSLVLS